MLTLDERELRRQMRELAAAIVVPTAPRIGARGRVPLWPALAAVALLMIALVAVSPLVTRDGRTVSPGSPAPVPTATVTSSACPSASPQPSHRATPYPGLPSSAVFPTPCVTHTITGTITELGPQGQRPVAGARVSVYLYASNRSGHWMTDVTEADGRYELWGLFPGAIAVLHAGKEGVGYVQPCVHQVTVTSDMSVNIEIVPRSAGAAAATAAALRGAGSFLTGVVFEASDGTRAPIPDAMVWLGGDMTPVAATTITDADGRYAVCGLPRGSHEFAVTAPGYEMSRNAVRMIDVAGDMTLDVELKR